MALVVGSFFSLQVVCINVKGVINGKIPSVVVAFSYNLTKVFSVTDELRSVLDDTWMNFFSVEYNYTVCDLMI